MAPNSRASKTSYGIGISLVNRRIVYRTTKGDKEEQNLILLGKCGMGKSGLAVQLGETAISNGNKTYYVPFDNFIAVAEKKATNPKAEAIFLICRNVT